MSDDQLDGVLSPRELEELAFGYRERVTDMELPHIRGLPSMIPGVFAARGRPRRTGWVSTASSCTTRTLTRWRRFSRRSTRVTMDMAARARTRPPAARDVSRRARRGRRRIRRRLPVSSPTNASLVATRSRMPVLRRRVRTGRHGLPVALTRREIRGCQSSSSWLGCLSVHRSKRLGMHADAAGRRPGTVRAKRRAVGADPAAVRAAGFETPVIVSGGIHHFDQAEAILERGEADVCGAARQSLADPDWFRKVRLGRGEPRPPLHIHQLL